MLVSLGDVLFQILLSGWFLKALGFFGYKI